MTTRREFIQSLAAASALPLGSVTNAGANWSQERRVENSLPVWPLYRFLVDERFPESVKAGRAAADQGIAVHLMNAGDITPFWYNDLSLRWRQAPVAVAGMTGHGPLFVLELFAWDYGMRVIVREEHPPARDAGDTEPLFSWLIGLGSGLSKNCRQG